MLFGGINNDAVCEFVETIMRKFIAQLYRHICLLSPRIEIFLRKIYWRNVQKLKRFSPNKTVKVSNHHERKHVDFDSVISFLKELGVGEGSVLVVHSSYDVLECTGLSPDEIIDKLLSLVGESGTLAMPCIRRFKGEPKPKDLLTADTNDLICTYNVRKTTVISGILPFTLMRRNGCAISHFPFNPMVAYGASSDAMVAHNLDGKYPSAHGPNSAWKYCYDHNAYVVGLGVDLAHYNTIIHTNEEAFNNWPYRDDEWYRLRKFKIVDENMNETDVIVRERKPEWGMVRFAELCMNRDIDKRGIIKRKNFANDVLVCVERAKDVVDFLQDMTKKNKVYYY